MIDNDGLNITLKDLATKTGYSLVSIHRALTGKSGVSDSTRNKILSAAQEMGYIPNIMASALKRKQLTIAIVFPETGNVGALYFNYLWKGCKAFIEECAGYQVRFLEETFHLEPGSENESLPQLEVLDRLYEQHAEDLDGLLVVPMENTKATRQSLHRFTQKGIQIVLIDNDFPDINRLCCVAASDHNTGRLAAEMMCSMVQCDRGTILVAAGNRQSFSHQMNAAGFVDYVRTHSPGLQVNCVYDTTRTPKAEVFYETMQDSDVIAAYSVRARNTIPLCEACLLLEGERKLLVLGSDLFDRSAEMLRRGILKGIVYKNPYQKGYLGVKVLFEKLIRDISPRSDNISVPISIIMQSNLVFFEEFI